ncbi:MAG: pyridoxamine 5'-phosphate oxidase family protein, partial [Cytophagales bacterium]|nr:pyridoxamine 5'-phosphate oxidase family protein [Cytophagales bacterium]
MPTSPYHPGELEMQQRTGEEIPAYRNSRIIVPYIATGVVKYMETQPFVVVSSQDGQGRLWTSILSGADGYVKVRDEETISLDRSLLYSNPEDRFWNNIGRHPFVGMLFIDFATRRRYRVNGPVREVGGNVLVSVRQAYINCPKYISRRTLARGGGKPGYGGGFTRGNVLTQELGQWIGAADAFFVGSSNGAGDLDASHRGGNPGFVEVLDATTLRVPDYEGNSMYNTLGNFLQYPKAGLLFVDFTEKRTLQLTGTASV